MLITINTLIMFDQYGYQPAPTLAEAIEDLRPIYKEHFPLLTEEVITQSATRILVRDGICSNNLVLAVAVVSLHGISMSIILRKN